MLNFANKLNHKLFESYVQFVSMRLGFGEGLVEAGMLDRNVVALCADLVESTGLKEFKNKFPDRFFELGVAEQNLATVASGMASMGKIPFMASYAVFSPGRNWEQIRTTICYNNLPVKIIGSHAGVNVGPDGGSHQALEDIALMRVLPRMVVISPCDAVEAKKAAIAVARTGDPTYIRLPREKSAIITTDHSPFKIGKAMIIFKPTTTRTASVGNSRNITVSHNSALRNRNSNNSHKADVGIIVTGYLTYEALLAARILESANVNVIVMHLSTVKPLDEEAIVKLASETRAIVTVEDHQIAGGMGSAVAELLASHVPVPIEFVGVKDKFGQSGTAAELIEVYELGHKDIVEAVKKVLIRK